MSDLIIDAGAAIGLQTYADRTRPIVRWMIIQDQSDHRGKFVGRLVTDGPTSFVLVADTLAELRLQLPPDLVCSQRQPADPPEVVEFWFSA